MNFRTVLHWLAACLLLCSTALWAQSERGAADKGGNDNLEDNTGHRDNLVLIPSGDILLVTQPNDDVAGVVIEAPDGTQGSVADPNECLGDCGGADPLRLQGVGSNPDMNNNGVAAFKGSFLHCLGEAGKGIDCPEPKGGIDSAATAHGIFTGTPAGLTTIAIARDFENGDPIDGDTFCDFEPMPRINENGQVFFGAHTDIAGGLELELVETNDDWQSDPEGGATCGGFSFNIEPGQQRKGIYRWTAPSTLHTLLNTQADFNLTTIVVSDTNFVDSTTEFAITDTHLNTQGSELVNNGGNVVAYGMFDDDPLDDDDVCNGGKGDEQIECAFEHSRFLDDRMGLLYLRGENDRSLIAMAGPPGESIFQEVQEGALNQTGQVVFKTQTGVQEILKGSCSTGPCINSPQICGVGEDFDDGCETSPELGSQLNIWTNALAKDGAKGVALNTFVESGDPVPGGSTADFGGFTKHADINDSGHVAFIGSIDLGGSCDQQDIFQNPEVKGNQFEGNLCKGVYWYNGGFIQEIARTTTANQQDPGGGTKDNFEGFAFDNIGAVAIINNQDKVVWTAENQDSDPECGVPEYNPDGEGFGSGERTGVFAWTPDMGYAKIVQEGDVIDQGRVVRLFTPQPELRQHINDAGTFVIRLWVDDDGNCTPDQEVILSAEMRPPSEIPALTPWALLLLAGLLGMGGVSMLRRKA